MLRQLYDWTMRFAGRPNALWALAAVSFIESSVFPIPPDVLLIPMVLAARERAWRIAFVCTAASVLGGLAGYGIGLFLFETVGRPLVEFYGAEAAFAAFQEGYNAWGAWIVAGFGFTILPYKVITILSGVTNLDLSVFLLASILSRGARFFLEAALLWYVGPPLRRFMERNLEAVATLFLVALVGGFVLVKFAF